MYINILRVRTGTERRERELLTEPVTKWAMTSKMRKGGQRGAGEVEEGGKERRRKGEERRGGRRKGNGVNSTL